jgi:L-threonylcarbamoyladenylate synthase
MTYPSKAELARAAGILRAGGLVAFPTETVYGLGANALDEAAVRRIYEAKGRPSTSPLIVHIADLEMAPQVAAEWPKAAQKLAARFWPGPLTLILRKRLEVPALVTAGLDTVGVRMPAHPVALELIRLVGVPVAAPSANRFMEISPTTAEHVRVALGGRVDCILDAGPCEVGIESTVLSLVGGRRILLRPGMISQRQIEEIIGPVDLGSQPADGAGHVAPGLHQRHYAPKTPLYLLDAREALPEGRGRLLNFPGEPESFAASLYSELHAADREGWEWIAIRKPPATVEWAGILDRLTRASRHEE